MVNKKVKIHSLNDYDQFSKFVDKLPDKGPNVYFLFTGKKKENGRSWCIYCQLGGFPLLRLLMLFNETDNVYYIYNFIKNNSKTIVPAEPIVKAYLEELQKNIIFVYVDVGDRDYWKDKACPFRTDSRTRLMVIPTIVKWKGVQRLEGSQCNKRDLLQMMFEEEE